MAAFAKPAWQGSPSPATVLFPANCKISGLICGEDIAIGDACYVKSDGKVWRSIGTAANAAAKVRGFAATPGKVAQNDAVTLVFGVVFGWPNAGTPGADLFLGAVAGGLDTAATTGGTAPVGYVIDANRVYLDRSAY